jgi:hypothetical protein
LILLLKSYQIKKALVIALTTHYRALGGKKTGIHAIKSEHIETILLPHGG